MEQCTEAVDALHALAGANGIYDRYPIQRLFRDQHALSAHIGFSWDAQGGPWALVAMGGSSSARRCKCGGLFATVLVALSVTTLMAPSGG